MASARAISRETCICETPICSAICTWVMFSTNRRASTCCKSRRQQPQRRPQGLDVGDRLELAVVAAQQVTQLGHVILADPVVQRARAVRGGTVQSGPTSASLMRRWPARSATVGERLSCWARAGSARLTT